MRRPTARRRARLPHKSSVCAQERERYVEALAEHVPSREEIKLLSQQADLKRAPLIPSRRSVSRRSVSRRSVWRSSESSLPLGVSGARGGSCGAHGSFPASKGDGLVRSASSCPLKGNASMQRSSRGCHGGSPHRSAPHNHHYYCSCPHIPIPRAPYSTHHSPFAKRRIPPPSPLPQSDPLMPYHSPSYPGRRTTRVRHSARATAAMRWLLSMADTR